MKRSVFILITVIFSFLTFVGCAPKEKGSQTEKEQLNVIDLECLTVILHAGGELDGMRLLNCQEAFYVYYEKGYRIFEYDLKLSSDGKLIGTHSWEHLTGGYDGMSYDAFLSLRLEGGYTPVNEDWLIETLKQYPDVTVIVDAKMEDTLQDAEVIKRLHRLQDEREIDLSDRIIPEVFSVEMWEAIRTETAFNNHLFSRYKEYYSMDTVVESFPLEKFIGIALPYDYLDGYYQRNIAYLQEIGYRIFMFGINNTEDILGAVELGADTVYIDDVDWLPTPSDATVG